MFIVKFLQNSIWGRSIIFQIYWPRCPIDTKP